MLPVTLLMALKPESVFILLYLRLQEMRMRVTGQKIWDIMFARDQFFFTQNSQCFFATFSVCFFRLVIPKKCFVDVLGARSSQLCIIAMKPVLGSVAKEYIRFIKLTLSRQKNI